MNAILFSALNGAALAWRIRIEEAALRSRRGLPADSRGRRG
jgi:hypothetical protein